MVKPLIFGHVDGLKKECSLGVGGDFGFRLDSGFCRAQASVIAPAPQPTLSDSNNNPHVYATTTLPTELEANSILPASPFFHSVLPVCQGLNERSLPTEQADKDEPTAYDTWLALPSPTAYCVHHGARVR